MLQPSLNKQNALASETLPRPSRPPIILLSQLSPKEAALFDDSIGFDSIVRHFHEKGTPVEELSSPLILRRFSELIMRSKGDIRCLLSDEDPVKRRRLWSEFFETPHEPPSLDEEAQIRKLHAYRQEIFNYIRRAGIDIELLLRVGDVSSYSSHLMSNATIYNALASLEELTSDTSIFSPILQKHAAPKVIPRLSFKYDAHGRTPGTSHSLSFNVVNCPSSSTGRKSARVYMDSHFALVLQHLEFPQAILGFTFDYEGKTMTMVQNQGIRTFECDAEGTSAAPPILMGSSLYGIQLRPLLFSLGEVIAARAGAATVVIQGARNNMWIKPNKYKEKPTYTLEQAHAHYDAIASELKYQQNSQGNWEKKLATG